MSDPPKIIYKYRDWGNKNHKSLLLNQELYISSPKDFNDPFDCRITKNFHLLDTDEKIWAFVKHQIANLRQDLLKNENNIVSLEQKMFMRLKLNREKEQKDWDDYTYRKQDDHYGIISFSEIWDSILMWGHYACNHSGFCVGFHEEKLRNSGNFGSGGPVIYSDDLPNINPLDDISIRALFLETHTKASDWQYEREYRLTKLYFPEAARAEDRTVKISKDCFAEILIGIKFPKDQINWMSDLAFDLGAKLFEVKQIPFQFKLTREELT
jgi:hypothetical protein